MCVFFVTYDRSVSVVERHLDLFRPLAFRKGEGIPLFCHKEVGVGTIVDTAQYETMQTPLSRQFWMHGEDHF